MLKSLICMLLVVICSPLQGMWLDGKADGWAWYEDKEKKPGKQKQNEEQNPESKEKSFAEKLNALQKKLDEAKAKAVLEPTKENVYAYQFLQKNWSENASVFTSVWTKNLLEHPELDSRIENPVTQYGINSRKEIDAKEKDALCKSLAQDHLLFFFYQGGEKPSQIFSVLIKEFSERHGFSLVGIVSDGTPIEGIHTLPDNGISNEFKASTFPSVYLVNQMTGSHHPISHGLSSLDQIENNIWTQFSNPSELKK